MEGVNLWNHLKYWQQDCWSLWGKENIISVTHCATRLRPQLKDRSLVDADAIEHLDGVTGLVNKDSGLQIIIGMNVGDIYKAFMKVWDSEHLERDDLVEKAEAGPKSMNGLMNSLL